MTAPPILRLLNWFEWLWLREESRNNPPALPTECGWCKRVVPPGEGHWDQARRTILCSDDCWDQHVSSWAI